MTTNATCNPLHRLESYQSGTIGGSNGGDDNSNERPFDANRTPSSSVGVTVQPLMKRKFSLVGDGLDSGDIEEVMEGDAHYILGHQGRLWRQWHMYHRRILLIVSLLCFGLLLLTLVVLAMSSISRIEKGSPASTSSEQITCPIQSSYFVSADIMELRNSSTGEYSRLPD